MWLGAVCCAAALAAAAGSAPHQEPSTQGAKARDAAIAHGIEVVPHGGYPELRVDGAPFFIESAAFSYYRIPRQEWARLLEAYRSIGINTIDIYIPWNWHEPTEGGIDFDGHTNPRRDLRGLLALIAQKKLKLIARPGPEILNEWRHGGYPGWLLERPEYKMNLTDRLEGRYPPLDALNVHDADAAARGWLENHAHMRYARQWLTAVGKELAPYSSHRTVHSLPDDPGAHAFDSSGPLLFVQLGDDFAAGRNNRVGADFWRYVGELRAAVEAGGVDVPLFINPTGMCVPASGANVKDSLPGAPIGVMGQWYMQPRADAGARERLLDSSDASEIELFTEELGTQPAFPPVMIEYQAGWYAPGDDDRPLESAPDNTLLSSRLLIAGGIHGINYFPLQDTYTPAGYSVPWASRAFRWDAALDPNGERQPRLQAILRNTQWLAAWGPQLAASHKRADFGIADPLTMYPQDQLRARDIGRVSAALMRIERLAALATLSSELLDPAHQPLEQLLRDPLLLLPVFDPGEPQFQMSERAQRAIVEYVRRGGALAVFPARPQGKIIDELWSAAPDASPPAGESAIRRLWKFGDGQVIESSKDFFSWLALDRSLAENRAQRESPWAGGVLREFLAAARVEAAVKASGSATGASDLVASEIVANEGTLPLGERNGGWGFLSLVNLGDDQADVALDLLSPAASARSKSAKYEPLHVVVPSRESLLLPLDSPLCSPGHPEAPCSDAVVAGGAELLDAHREGRTLQLFFYAPARAEIRLHLQQQPSHVTLEELKPEAHWDPGAKELQVIVPRGAAPQFFRLLKLDLPYKPDVPEVEKPGKPVRSDFDFFVANGVRLPAGGSSFLRAYPPLVVLDPGEKPTVLVQGENHHAKSVRDANITFDGDLRGSGSLQIPPLGASVEKIRLKPPQSEGPPPAPGPDGLLHGRILVHSGKEDRAVPIAYLQTATDATTRYRYDFDGDGADEWVLENTGLRVVVSPESGGEVVAFVDKASGANLTSSVGLLRDAFSYTENPTEQSSLRPRGRWGLSTRPYSAEWLAGQTNPALKLRYDAPDVYPAGARIEKTIQFEDADNVRVDYRIALRAAGPDSTEGALKHTQSFVAMNSFPAVAGDHPTQFCPGTADAGKGGNDGAQQHCEDFARGGKLIELAAGTQRVEVRTPGRPSVALEWDCAQGCPRLTIEPKNFSALFRLEYPAIVPGGAALQGTVRFRVRR